MPDCLLLRDEHNDRLIPHWTSSFLSMSSLFWAVVLLSTIWTLLQVYRWLVSFNLHVQPRIKPDCFTIYYDNIILKYYYSNEKNSYITAWLLSFNMIVLPSTTWIQVDLIISSFADLFQCHPACRQTHTDLFMFFYALFQYSHCYILVVFCYANANKDYVTSLNTSLSTAHLVEPSLTHQVVLHFTMRTEVQIHSTLKSLPSVSQTSF